MKIIIKIFKIINNNEFFILTHSTQKSFLTFVANQATVFKNG